MQEIRDKLADMEVRNQRTEEREMRIEHKIDNIQSELTKLKAENQVIKYENEKLRKEIYIQNRKIELMEREIRGKNLVIFGVEETEDESPETQQQKVEEIIKKTGIEISPKIDIAEIRRIGQRGVNKNRPIKIEMINGNRRDDILRSTRHLKNTTWRIDEDYPKDIQIQRKQLVKYMKLARDQGKRATIKYNRLIINGEAYDIEDVERWEKHGQEENQNRGKQTPMKKAGARSVSDRTPTDEDKLREESLKMTKTTNHSSKN